MQIKRNKCTRERDRNSLSLQINQLGGAWVAASGIADIYGLAIVPRADFLYILSRRLLNMLFVRALYAEWMFIYLLLALRHKLSAGARGNETSFNIAVCCISLNLMMLVHMELMCDV